jgi:hypothetical protein
VSALLAHLQQRLQRRYDVDPCCRVADFLTTDRRFLPRSVDRTGTDEQLLVLAEHDGLAMSVFIDARVLRRLARTDPLRRLHGGNLADFWTALEGVSHFVCVAWNALHDRIVSRLDLELQAEVDKFVLTADVLREQGAARHPPQLHRLLFEHSRVDPQLAGARASLYRTASDHAARYCRSLEPLMGRAGHGARASAGRSLAAELKRFYRRGDVGKIGHIGRGASHAEA